MKKILNLILTTIFIFNFSYAEIIADGQTDVYVEKSNNGIEIINISTPTNKGISYSTFKLFNIDDKGAVLNNKKYISKSDIAGIINGNNNIKDIPAKLAILDVNGLEKSEIKGLLEAITKDKLDVIISNENGITLDGAKFLNINDLKITTAKPIMEDGDYKGLSKPKGDIKNLDELNVSNIYNFETISNSFESTKDILSNNLIIQTYSGEQGIPISAEIIGSIYGENVRIVATNSGIGVNNVVSKKLDLVGENLTFNNIKTNEVNIDLSDNYINNGVLISNENINITAKNILNDSNFLISDNIALEAKENIFNLNGGIIHADNNLKLKANNLYNIGRLNDYGEYDVKWRTYKGDILTKEEVENKWIKDLEIKYESYNALRGSTLKESKINALSAIYDEIVKINDDEFEYRSEDNELKLYNQSRAGKKGELYNLDEYTYILNKENIEETKQEHAGYLFEKGEETVDFIAQGYTHTETLEGTSILKGFIENKNQDINFSILSGNNIQIDVVNSVNNKDGHLIANKKNIINANEFNNSSSVSDIKVKLTDGYEKMIYNSDRTCRLGLIVCEIYHLANYKRDLGFEREVNIKALKSQLVGEEIEINANNVNFNEYDETEVKNPVRSDDLVYINSKKEIEINGKKLKYSIEENPEYISIGNFLKSPYFIKNILKDNADKISLLKDLRVQDRVNEEIEEKIKKSNLKINSKNIIIKDELEYNNIDFNSENVNIIGTNILALNSLNISAKNLKIEDKKEKIVNIIQKKFEDKLLVKKNIFEKQNIEKSIKTNIVSKNINIDSNSVLIKGSNILGEESINIKADELNIINTKNKKDIYEENNNKFLANKHKYEKKEKEEIIEKSSLVSDKINIESNEVKVKASDLLGYNELNIKAENVEIKDDYNTLTKEEKINDRKLDAKVEVNKKGINASLKYSDKKQENENDSKLSVASKLMGSNIKIEATKDVVSNADILAENLEINAENISLLDRENKINEKRKSTGFSLELKANAGSSVLDVASNLADLFDIGKKNKENQEDGNILSKAGSKFRNIRNISSNIHTINKVISGAFDPSKLIDVSVGVGFNFSLSNLEKNIVQSQKSSIFGTNILLNAKKDIVLKNQEITSENLEINSDKVYLLQGENKLKIKESSHDVGVDFSYNPLAQTGSVGVNYANQKYELERIKYEDNILNVNNLKINAKEVIKEKKEDVEKEEKTNFEIGISASFGMSGVNGKPEFQGAQGNIGLNGNGFSLGMDKDSKITSGGLKIDNVNYDLHLDLVHKENREKLVDDLKNTINTPKAYINAIDTVLNIEKTEIFKEIQKEIFTNNVETETSLRKYNELLNSAKTDEEKVEIVKSYYKEIGRLGGKEFSDIIFVDNLTNKNSDMAFAGITEDNKLYLHINNVDILNLESTKKLVTFETKRWKYEDEEVDDRSLHYNLEEIQREKTNINVNTVSLTNEEMNNIRNYTNVPTFSDKEIKNKMDYFSKNLKGNDKKNFEKLNSEQKRIVVENMLLKEKLEGKSEESDLRHFIANPNSVYTAVDRKGYTTKQLERIAKASYISKLKPKKNSEEEKKFIEENKDIYDVIKNLKVKEEIINDITGLKGYIFVTPSNEYIVSFRGTAEPRGVLSDIGLVDGVNMQYEQAYKKLKNELEKSEYKGKTILIVGHSLGGGIARYVTKRLPNTQAIVFDPAPSASIETERYNRISNNDFKKYDYYIKTYKTGFDNSGYKDVLAILPNNALLNSIAKNKKGENIAQFNTKLPINEDVLSYMNSTNEYLEKKKEIEKTNEFREYNKIKELILKTPGNEENAKYYKRYNELRETKILKDYFDNEFEFIKLQRRHNTGSIDETANYFSH